jgi:hypothetical protein
MHPIIAQAIGILATVITILSFQQKNQRGIVIFQATSSVLWSIHFISLGAYTGGVLNIIASARNIVMSQRSKWKWVGSPLLVVIMIILSFTAYALSFLLFGVEPTVTNLLLELLPTVGLIITTLAFREKEGKRVRLLSLLNSPFWLTYDAFSKSLGGVITEVFCLISIGIGYYRHDRAKKTNR